MVDNLYRYGFHFVRSANGMGCPPPIELPVATGYQAQVGTVNVDLNIGDPVVLSNGNVQLCPGSEGTPGDPWGIIVGIGNFGKVWDGSRMTPNDKIPGGTAWGTILERQSKVLVVPAHWGIWSVVVDDTTATDEATYQSYVGSNMDHVLEVDSDNSKAKPELDRSSVATTATLQWRVLEVDRNVSNKDFSEDNVRLLVTANAYSFGGAPKTPIVGT